MEKIEDFEFEFEGFGLTQTKKGKAKHSEPLFMVYFSKGGTAKGKFTPEAVKVLNLKPEAIGTGKPIYKTVNIAPTNKGKVIYTFNSTETASANIEKKTLSPNYIIDLSAKEVKMIYEANGLKEKEDCYFSLTAKKTEILGVIYILQPSDIKVEKTERTAEQKKRSAEVSTELTAEHIKFRDYANLNKIDTSGKGVYMAVFQTWKKTDATLKAVTKTK